MTTKNINLLATLKVIFFFIVILISAKLLEVQKALSLVKMEIGELSEQVLPGLVQELGELQATSILKGDYELKIARQDYFIMVFYREQNVKLRN